MAFACSSITVRISASSRALRCSVVMALSFSRGRRGAGGRIPRTNERATVRQGGSDFFRGPRGGAASACAEFRDPDRRAIGYRAPVGWTKLCPQAPARADKISNVKEGTVIKVMFRDFSIDYCDSKN